MKKFLITILLVALFISNNSSFSKATAQTFGTQSIFINFYSGGVLVQPNIDTVIPITSSTWARVQNHSDIFQAENDRIYILYPGYRITMNGYVQCTTGGMKYYLIQMLIYDVNGIKIGGSNPVVQQPQFGVVQNSFYMTDYKDLTVDDFVNGNPYIKILFKHNASLPQICTPQIEINAK